MIEAPTPAIGGGGSALLAISAAAAISTVYLPQALVGPIAAEFHVPLSTAGIIATVAQVCHALGIVLLVPLGDMIRPRLLVTALFSITALSLAAAALAPSLGLLVAAFALGGLTCVIPAILIPLAGAMSAPANIGRTVAAVGTGIGLGIFGSRVLAGIIMEAFGWRAVPSTFAVLALISCAAIQAVVPRVRARAGARYLATLRSLVPMLLTKPALREAVWMQFWVFCSMNALWTVTAVHLTTQLGWSQAGAGAFALVGLVASANTPFVGRLIDSRGPRIVLTLGLVTGVASVVILGFFPTVPAALITGHLLLTLTAQGSQVAQQARIFAESPRARSAVNTVFMAVVFAGGAAGAAIGIPVHVLAGLPGIALFVGVCVALSALGLIPGVGRRAAAVA